MNDIQLSKKTVVKLSGEIRMNTIISVRKELEKAVEKSCHIALDMADVTYIDSSGVTLLINVAFRVREEGGMLSFYNLKSHLRDLFDVTDIPKVAKVEPAEK